MEEIDYIQWQPEFKTGIDKIDDGRLQFIKLHNQLVDIVNKEYCDQKIVEFLYALIHYAEHHLLNEEICYRSFDGLTEHKARHQTFVDTISEIRNHIAQKNSEVGCKKLLVYLHGWFHNHIMHQDKEVLNTIKHNQSKAF
ncbi:MAG: hemerythrin domain-containing protein [Salinivirgaceae bacterium]|jgi:hemerythrin